MKLVFFGTPDYVIPILDTLHKEFKSKTGESPIAAVVTQSPKPVGRSKKLEYSAVDHWAHKKNIPVYYNADDLMDDGVIAEFGITASYGALLPQETISYFPNGLLNVHPSLLPKWRSASPIQATIIDGKEAGLTIMKVDEKLDHGPIVGQFKDELLEEDTNESLRNRLFMRASEILPSLIQAYLSGKITLKPQNHTEASYANLIKKEFALIPPQILNSALQGETSEDTWEIPFMFTFEGPEREKVFYKLEGTPKNIDRFIRAMHPWPGAWTNVTIRDKNQRLKILNAHVEEEKLVLDEVQLEGKNPVPWKQFKEAYKDFKLN